MIKPIAIIAGEPNSISSEIIFKSWKIRSKYVHKPFLIIGSISWIERFSNEKQFLPISEFLILSIIFWSSLLAAIINLQLWILFNLIARLIKFSISHLFVGPEAEIPSTTFLTLFVKLYFFFASSIDLWFKFNLG